MTPTHLFNANTPDEQLALILDPERKRAGWWDWHGQHYGGKRIKIALYTGPPLTTDRMAAFQHVVPVLHEIGCKITESKQGCWVRAPWLDGQDCIGGGCLLLLAPACAAAIAWIQANEPERLRKAVENTAH